MLGSNILESSRIEFLFQGRLTSGKGLSPSWLAFFTFSWRLGLAGHTPLMTTRTSFFTVPEVHHKRIILVALSVYLLFWIPDFKILAIDLLTTGKSIHLF